MKQILSYALLLFAIGSTSCQQKMYFPERANTPALREAYEAKLTLSLKPQSNSNDSGRQRGNGSSFAGDFAFSPAKNFGLFGSYRSINHRYIDEDNSDVYGGDFTGHRWEGGVGYYSPFDRLGKVEVYVGYGRGTIERYSLNTPYKDFKARYNRFFIQPGIGLGNHIYSVTGGFRLAYQRYNHFEARDSMLRYTILDNGRRDVEKETMAFIEPFINGEVGWKYIKYNMQVGCTAQIMGGNVSGVLPFYISFGLVFQVAPSYFQKEQNYRRKHRE